MTAVVRYRLSWERDIQFTSRGAAGGRGQQQFYCNLMGEKVAPV